MKAVASEYLTVTELNRVISEALESHFPVVKFEGEISEVKVPASGHLYITIKDEKSQISAVCWRGTVAGLKCKPEPGAHVLVHGKPNIFQAAGRLQIVIQQMFPAGLGALQKKFLELKEKLEKEGLFSIERKRPLPFMPTAIGVVTSATGAVIHDIMVKIRERMPSLHVYLIDVRVQGEGAALEIAEGVRVFNEFGKVDVILVARGGGSLEDLWAFNEEVVVRAIFASRIPVVSGVGHEVDFTLSDFVADYRAPTPTAAAERIVPHREELLRRIQETERRLVDYDRWLAPLYQQVDDGEARLNKRIDAIVQQGKLHLQSAEAKVKLLEPGRILELLHSRIGNSVERLSSALERIYNAKKSDIVRLSSKLEALSPLGVLKRGYALVESKGKVITSSKDVAIKDSLKVSFSSGGVLAEVTEKISGR